MATFQRVWDDFSNLPKPAVFKTMDYSPGFLLKIGRFRTLANSHGIFTNKPKNSQKSICKHAGDVSECLGPISQTYQNPPSSKPWAIALAFCSKSVDFGPLRILTESLGTSPKTVRNPFASMEATFQKVWDDFSNLPKSALFKTMGYSPGFLLKIGRFRILANSHGIFRNKPKNSQKSICKHAGDVSESLGRFLALSKILTLQNHGLWPRLFAQNRSISDPCEFSRNLQEQAQKQLEIHLQAGRRRFREFGTIFRTYQNPPSSTPCAIGQAFCSKWVDFGHLRILTESLGTSPKTVRNPFASRKATFQRVWDDFSHLPKSALFKSMGYSPGFLLKIGRFRTLANSHGIFTNKPKNSQKSIFKHAGDVSESLGRFLALTKIRPLQNHGLQPRLFAQNRSNFGHLRILTESLPTCSKIVRNQLSSMQATFQRVWDDFSHLPKSALFKTMGYSPGFLLKIGRFRTLANSHGIFTNKPKNSQKSIFKHAGDVSESLGRFLALTKIRPLQNHGLQPRLFAQNGSISDTCEFSRNLYKQPQKQLEIHLQACRRRFRKFGTISRTYQNPPSSKPWAIAQAFCSKSVDFGHLRILTESLPKCSKTSQKSTFKHDGDVSESLGRFLALTKIRPLQNHGLQPRLFAQNRSISDTCEFSRNLYQQAQKQTEIHFQVCRRRFREFGTISRTYQNPPSSKPWAIAQAFCSKSVNSGHLRILTESLPTCSKIVRNQLSSMQATFQRVWDDFSHLPKSALFKTMGYSPGFLLKMGRFQTLANSHGIFTNMLKNSSKSPFKHAGDVSESLGRFLALTKIRPLQNHGLQPRRFCSKSVNFGHLRILTDSLQTSPKTVRNPFASMQATFQKVWDDFQNLPKSALFKTMGYSPGFLLKIGQFRTLANSHGIFTKKPKNSHKSICKHAGEVSESLGRFLKLTKIRPLQNHGLQPRLFAQNGSISDTCEFSRNLYQHPQKQLEINFQACRRSFREFGTISQTYQNPPYSKPWAIAQAICSKWVDFGHLRILTESLPTSSKIVGNPLSSMEATFQRVWDDFSKLPKSALFKTMGYSPGFLLKIGRFRTLANSHGIFTNKPKNSQKSICKHAGDVSESLGRFLELTKIRPLQNHGLQPRLFAQNRSISDPCEFSRNLYKRAQKQLEIHLQACRRRFREFGTISRTYQNPPSSKPWAIAQAFCSKWVDFGHLRILTESLPTCSKIVRNPLSSMMATFQRVWDDFSHLPKSALFKTMGYSPGFLLKIGRFRTLANSHGIFTNMFKSSWKSTFKHAGDVSESLGRFLALTKIRPLQNHGLQPRLFAQNGPISDPCEFSRDLQEQAQKQ